MHVYVDMHVYVHVCMYVSMCICKYTYACICIYASICAWMYPYMHICIYMPIAHCPLPMPCTCHAHAYECMPIPLFLSNPYVYVYHACPSPMPCTCHAHAYECMHACSHARSSHLPCCTCLLPSRYLHPQPFWPSDEPAAPAFNLQPLPLTCQAMPILVHRTLCLNGSVVPVEALDLPFVDPYDIASEEPDEDRHVSLVHFNARSPSYWLCQNLDMPASPWWKQHRCNVPLFKEILNLIKAKKTTLGSAFRLPRNPKSLVPLKIREKVLWFENSSKSVTLALTAGDEDVELQWFLDELQKDIFDMAGQYSASSCAEIDEPDLFQSPAKVSKKEAPANIKEYVNKTLKAIQEHQACSSAWFLNSRNAFRVIRKDMELKEFVVKSLKKEQSKAVQTDDYENLKSAFDVCMYKCIEFLNLPPGGAGLAAPAAPLADAGLAAPAAPLADAGLAGPAAPPADAGLA